MITTQVQFVTEAVIYTMWQIIVMWCKLQIKSSTFGVLASSLRIENNVFKFSCKLYKQAWGIKDIKINMGDFCSKRGSLKDTRPVLPSCDKHIFPSIEFFSQEKYQAKKKCVVNMRLGKTSKENINCVNQIVGRHNSFDNKKELWIIYTTHGHRGADVIKRYNEDINNCVVI